MCMIVCIWVCVSVNNFFKLYLIIIKPVEVQFHFNNSSVLFFDFFPKELFDFSDVVVYVIVYNDCCYRNIQSMTYINKNKHNTVLKKHGKYIYSSSLLSLFS